MDCTDADWNFDPQDWIGRTFEASEIVGVELIQRFAATIMEDKFKVVEGDPAPLGIHWCIAPPALPSGQVGSDGHPRKGILLPPIPLPNRMWAGGDLEFLKPVRTGDHLRRKSTIEAIERKQGRSGELCFVQVNHLYFNAEGEALRERQNIVYRDATTAAAAPAQASVPPNAETTRERFDPVRLFRYSAVTFNSHRIHYDYPYATGEEGYSGLVVHGPLQATLLMHLADSVLGGLKRFSFRGTRALICGPDATFWAVTDAGRAELGVADASGAATMTASAE